MEIQLLGSDFKVLDTKEKITIADSFVVRQNKIGGGNGEAKLYVGNDNNETKLFFGKRGFVNKAFLLKKDLINYLNDTKIEYLKPEQPYRNKEVLPKLWEDRKSMISKLPDLIEFEIEDQNQISGPRVYVKSNNLGYKIIRELSLPNITYIAIVKLENVNGDVIYYFRLFADYFGDVEHPYVIEKEKEEIDNRHNPEEKLVLTKARVGQGKYRSELLELCPFCPITLISDDRLLIASHIKPWAKSTDDEKIDPYNGFMFTPTFDFLFDRGFISFTDDGKSILSPFLSKVTYSKLGLSDNRQYTMLPVNGREKYLEYHRSEVLKR